MFDAKRLLDQFLGGHDAFGGKGRNDQFGRGSGSPLGEIARTIGGGALGGKGMLAGGLASILLGSKAGRKLGTSALKVGGLALVGSLAYQAYRDWQAGSRPGAGTSPQGTAALPPADSPFALSDGAGQQSLGRNLLRAMIAAAKADGHIDAAEQANIFAKMDELDLDAEDKAFVMDELRAPLDVEAVAKAARTPEEAAEIYAASLLAVDVDNAAERGYLALLAARLGLDDRLVEHLHATIENAAPKAS